MTEPDQRTRRFRASTASVPARGFAFATGGIARYVVIALWIVAFVGGSALDLPGRFADAETNEARNFLPADAESTRAYDAINRIVKTESVPFVAVVRRDSGLTGADRSAIQRQLEAFNRLPQSATVPVTADGETTRASLRDVVAGPEGQRLQIGDISKDGTTALVLGGVRITGDGDRLLSAVDAMRSSLTPLERRDLTVKVTGGAGFSYDAIKVFGDLNASLAGAALALVFVLLILIYRSPVLLWLPLLAVVAAELISRSVGGLATGLGITVTGQSSAILSVLVLGAGTDYALLVTSRYREELRETDHRHDALRRAMASAGPAVLASGLTVIAGLLTLTVASVEGTAGLGPIGAIGVGVAMISMLTLLPALFAICGRGVFWPFVPTTGRIAEAAPRTAVWRLWQRGVHQPASRVLPTFIGRASRPVRHQFRTRYVTGGAGATTGFWRGVGERVAAAPRRTWTLTGLVLVALIGGLVTFNTNLSQSDTFVGTVESVEGAELLDRSFPGGASAPTQVVVPDAARAPVVAREVAALPSVASAEIVGRGEPGALIDVTLQDDPYSVEAQDEIPGLRRTAQQAGGDAVLVGGDTAINYDLARANDRDLKLIIPITLAVVLLILIALLRAVVLPLVLIATVVLSFAAALGISSLLWTQVFGFAGADRSIIIFAFVFLVALGIDYNIFLATRIREEAQRFGTREGILRGIGATGGVITAAGIVLAGTFLVLATTPVVFLVETGTAIALGVLLDTFIVRSILAPALSLDIGRRIWWPGQRAIPADEDAPG